MIQQILNCAAFTLKDSLHTWNAKISKKSFLRSSDSKFYMLSKNIIDVEELNINYGLNPL